MKKFIGSILFIFWTCLIIRGETLDIVMSTDDAYAIPTAITILSLKESTQVSKRVIILYPRDEQCYLSDTNIRALEQLSDDLTNVVLVPIPDTYIQKAKQISTSWNLLVQVRIFYQDLFNKLNGNPSFLKDIGGDPIKTFIHLDSDILLLKDLSLLLKGKSLQKRSYCLASTNLHFMSPERLQENIRGVSGGVVLWFLERINASSFNWENAFNDRIYWDLICRACSNKYAYNIWEILCQMKNPARAVGFVKNLNYKYLDKYWENRESYPSSFLAILKNLHYLVKEFRSQKILACKTDKEQENLIKNIMDSFIDYLNEESSEEKREHSNMHTVQNTSIQVNPNYPTEEEILDTLSPRFIFGHQYNFVLKYLFPETDKTSQTEFDKLSLVYPHIKSYADLRKALFEKYPEMPAEINQAFREVCVLHFDMCYKPWEEQFARLAEKNNELYKFIYLYKRYFDQLLPHSFEQKNIDRFRKAFNEALKSYDTTQLEGLTPLEILQTIDVNLE